MKKSIGLVAMTIVGWLCLAGSGSAALDATDQRASAAQSGAPTLKAVWTYGRRSTSFRRLHVRNLSSDATVEARCDGRGCPFIELRRQPRRGTVKLDGVLRGAGLRAGAELEITASAPNEGEQIFRLRIRRPPQDPRITSLCKPPGAETPTPC